MRLARIRDATSALGHHYRRGQQLIRGTEVKMGFRQRAPSMPPNHGWFGSETRGRPVASVAAVRPWRAEAACGLAARPLGGDLFAVLRALQKGRGECAPTSVNGLEACAKGRPGLSRGAVATRCRPSRRRGIPCLRALLAVECTGSNPL